RAQRSDLTAGEPVEETPTAIGEDVVQSIVSQHMPPQSVPEQWDIAGLEQHLRSELALEVPVQQWLDEADSLHEDGEREGISEALSAAYAENEPLPGAEALRTFGKQTRLRGLDARWEGQLG